MKTKGTDHNAIAVGHLSLLNIRVNRDSGVPQIPGNYHYHQGRCREERQVKLTHREMFATEKNKILIIDLKVFSFTLLL